MFTVLSPPKALSLLSQGRGRAHRDPPFPSELLAINGFYEKREPLSLVVYTSMNTPGSPGSFKFTLTHMTLVNLGRSQDYVNV